MNRWRNTTLIPLLLALAFVGPAQGQPAANYTYDELGRVISVSYPNGSQITYQYDPAGNRTQHVASATGGNQAPVAVNDTASTAFNTPTTFDPRTNDSDPNSDPITITAKTNGTKGTVAIGAGGTSLTYTPNAGQIGADSFSYTISDPGSATATATVSMTITAANNPPVAVNDTKSTAMNTPLTFDPRTNDSDPDSDPITVTAKTNGTKGAVSIGAGGTSLTYTPNAGQTGADSFTYTISDPSSATATATVSMTITGGANQPPVAVNDSGSVIAPTNAGLIITLDPRVNDSDPNSDPLTVTAKTNGTYGSVTILNGGTSVRYQRTSNYPTQAQPSKTDAFTYTISDGNGGTATATINVTVTRTFGGGGGCGGNPCP